MFFLDDVLKYLFLCLLWLCEHFGWKGAHQWLSKFVKEPDLGPEEHVV